MLGAEYLRLVLSRWRLVAALVLGGTLAGWLISTLVLAQNPKFEAAARLNIVPTSEELGYANRFVRGSTFDGGSTLLQTYAEFAHTRPVVAPIVDRFVAEQAKAAGQSEAAWVAANSVPSFFSPSRLIATLNYGAAPTIPLRQDIADALIEHTRIETVEGTYLLRITVEWDDPRAAAWFANALADAIIARAETMSQKSGSQIAGNLEQRLADKQGELAAALRRSRDLKAAAGVVDVDRQKQSLLEAQIAEQSQLTSDRAALQANEGQVAGLKRQTGGKLSTAQAAIEQTLALEGPKASGLARGIAIREGRVGQIKSQIAALGKQEDAIRALDDQTAQLRSEVAALTERVSFSQTENLANAPRIQLIERAVPPLVRSSPKTLFNTALGFIGGCALAGCALLILGEAPARIRQEEIPEDESEADDETAPTPTEPAPAAPPPSPVIRPILAPAPPVPDVARPIAAPGPAPFAPTPVLARDSAWALAGPDVLEDRMVEGATVPPSGPETLPVRATAEAELESAPEPIPEPGPEPVPEPLHNVVAGEEMPGSIADEEVPEPPVPSTLAVADAPVALEDRVFGYVLPPPRIGKRYDPAEVRGIGRQIADWLGAALASDRPLTIAATGDERDAQRLYQLIHDYRATLGEPVLTVDWSAGAGAFPRGAGKPLIYAGGGFGARARVAHLGGALVVVIQAPDAAFETLEAEARRLAILAGRAVHVVALGG